MTRSFVAVSLSALVLALSGTAHAFVAEDPQFALRGGVAAATAQLGDQLIPDDVVVPIAQVSPVAAALETYLDNRAAPNTELLRNDLAGVAAFYAARGYSPAWTEDGAYTAAAIALMDRIGLAADDGLDPDAYVLPVADLAGASPDTLAEADATLSLAVAAYARDAYAGRLDPRAIDADLDMARHFPDAAEAVTTVAAAADPAAALETYNPPHPEFAQLRSELIRLRAEAENAAERIVIPAGPTLRVGDADERVPIIRARLEVDIPPENATIYDESLAGIVREFQAQVGLNTDGVIGPNTLGALNGPTADPVSEIIANMERYRWLPRDLGDFYVQVNIPEYLLRIHDGGQEIYQTRVVTGLPSHQTPVFSDRIEHIIVNPYWNVPASIIEDEYYPVLRSDPGYFNRNDFEVTVLWEGQTYLVDPVPTDWSQISPGQISMRQRPGDGNALGHVKFMFPNRHAVYLHDTPQRSLFGRDARAFSHGCVRVMNPMEFADVLLMNESQWNAAALEALYGPDERQVNLTQDVPVHLTYFTAVIDESGTVQFKNDVYGHSAAVREALGLG